MQIPLQISTRKISLSNTAVDIIKHKVKKLELFCDKIIACRIMVETPHRHKHQGALYNVSIDISIPGGELAVKKEANEDMFVAIRDAFDAAKRQILQYAKKKKVKQMRKIRGSHEVEPPMLKDDEYQMANDFFDEFSLNDPSLGRAAAFFT